MADPTSVIGTVAAVLQLAQSACKTVLELYNFCSDVQNAPQEIKSISRNAYAFYMIISNLESSLRSDTEATGVSGDARIMTSLEALKISIEDCSNNCEAIMKKLIPHIRVASSSSQVMATADLTDGTSQIQRRRFSRGNLMWFFKRKEIFALRAELERTQATLNTAMLSAHLVLALKKHVASSPNILVQGSLDIDDDLALSITKYAASISEGDIQGYIGLNEDLGSALTKHAALVLGTRNDHVTGYDLLDDVLVDT
ncbi:hypothetical protein RU639_008147 [Aspergillus parasiticus]